MAKDPYYPSKSHDLIIRRNLIQLIKLSQNSRDCHG
jgi:hypothetical protein